MSNDLGNLIKARKAVKKALTVFGTTSHVEVAKNLALLMATDPERHDEAHTLLSQLCANADDAILSAVEVAGQKIDQIFKKEKKTEKGQEGAEEFED